MLGKELKTRILTELEQLPPAAQGRVLEFMQTLSVPRKPALNGNQLADMFGMIGDEDADDMQEAIETFGLCSAEC